MTSPPPPPPFLPRSEGRVDSSLEQSVCVWPMHHRTAAPPPGPRRGGGGGGVQGAGRGPGGGPAGVGCRPAFFFFFFLQKCGGHGVLKSGVFFFLKFLF